VVQAGGGFIAKLAGPVSPAVVVSLCEQVGAVLVGDQGGQVGGHLGSS
jgi:hypothetical protein